jgi:hypothetical protein
MYAQPLVATGKYTRYRELARPNSYDFLEYGQNGSTLDPNGIVADPDGPGPAPPIDIGNQDFSILSLRGNAVLRWEFRPGSALFFVWTQNREQDGSDGDFHYGQSMQQLASVKADNIFLTKITYYFGH